MQGTLPMIAVHCEPHKTLFCATLDARRALNGAATEAALADAASRMVVQLHGLAECLQGMADTGLCNVGVSASALQTSTRFVDGAWASATCVARAPPPVCSAVRMPRELCASVMQALVVLSAVEEDLSGELVEFKSMAAMVADEWPDMDTPGPLEVFRRHLRVAWTRGVVESYADPLARLAHAVTERLRGAVRAAGAHASEEGVSDALEYARRALRHLGDAPV